MTVWIFARNSKNMMIIRFKHPVKSSTTSLRLVTVCLMASLLLRWLNTQVIKICISHYNDTLMPGRYLRNEMGSKGLCLRTQTNKSKQNCQRAWPKSIKLELTWIARVSLRERQKTQWIIYLDGRALIAAPLKISLPLRCKQSPQSCPRTIKWNTYQSTDWKKH